MSKNNNQIKCLHCGTDNVFVVLANEDPSKIAYRCRQCTTSWRKS